ncbi:MAG TPA: hypothetical protein DC058_09510 [Planctomycetaceae bacterium]|nr:hypothetical protein [Planctomycetaceae bacterium]
MNVVKKSQNVIECGDPDSEQGPIDPEQAAKIAVQAYDPSEDPRLWRAVAGMWRAVCSEFVDVACGYASDGRPASEIAARLQKELADRLQQESNAAGEFREQFRRTAAEWVVRRRSDVVTADMHRQMMELHREREAAAERAVEQDRQNRERQAAELEAKAAELRGGRPSMKSSYLAR